MRERYIWLVLLAGMLAFVGLPNLRSQGINNQKPTNHTLKITTALTYQSFLIPSERISYLLQNNNYTGTDTCLVDTTGVVTAGMTTSSTVTVDGVSLTAAQASAALGVLGSDQRFSMPVDGGVTIVGTCTGNGDTILAVSQ